MPHFIEGSGSCSIEEYLKYEPERLQATELRIGELYMVMFALKRQIRSQGAFRLPARVQTVEKAADGKQLVVSTFFDDDHKPLFDCTSAIKDGYWEGVEEAVEFDGVDPYRAYYKGYRDEIDDGLSRLLNSQDLLVAS